MRKKNIQCHIDNPLSHKLMKDMAKLHKFKLEIPLVFFIFSSAVLQQLLLISLLKEDNS